MTEDDFQQGLKEPLFAPDTIGARLAGVTHGDFYPFPKIARPGSSHTRFAAAAALLVQFLNATLRDDPDAREYLARSGPVAGMPADFLRISFPRRRRRAPSRVSRVALLRTDGAGARRGASTARRWSVGRG